MAALLIMGSDQSEKYRQGVERDDTINERCNNWCPGSRFVGDDWR